MRTKPAVLESQHPHGRIYDDELPDSQTGDDFSATRGRQHGQKALAIPFGEVARRRLPVSFMRDLNCVKPCGVFLVFYLSKPEVRGNTSIKIHITSLVDEDVSFFLVYLQAI